MFSIRSHHKQAILKLINCITNRNESQSQQNVTQIDRSVFARLAQIITVYESVVNNKHNTTDTNADTNPDTDTGIGTGVHSQPNHCLDSTRVWLLANYNSKQFIEELFEESFSDPTRLLQSHHYYDTDGSGGGGGRDSQLSEEQLWTITLLVLNIMYKMRNCLVEHKMMLELGWICLSELDARLDQLKPNYNQILTVLQNALNEEKKDDRQRLEDCRQLTLEVKQLRQKIIDLQRNIIKVNKEKTSLTTGANSSFKQLNRIPTKRQTKTQMKEEEDDDEDEDDGEARDDFDFGSKPKRKSNPPAIGGQYKCDICCKPFGSSYRLNRHMYSHTGRRPYSCLWPACHRQFNDNYHLKRHMLTHTGEKPYVCQSGDCSRRFARPEDLKSHQKSHWTLTALSVQSNDDESNQMVDINDINDNIDNNDNEVNNDSNYI